MPSSASTLDNNSLREDAATNNPRATALAARILEGAELLASFVADLTEDEWRTPITNGNDRRTVGTIVHHVASMYPIEVDVAMAVAGGGAVTDVTWDAVAGINAKHAHEHSDVTKAEALDALRQNSRAAAAAIRTLADRQLDHAAPFSLSSGAPMTAQFVIEDHAVRHAWHHLAAIRAALRR